MVRSAHVLRVTRADDEAAFVLIQASPTGSRALDLKLVGTEGAAPYVASLRHDRASALMVKNAPCTPAEWEAILAAVIQNEPADDIEAVAAVRSEASITLTVRKRVQGITQRLGAIVLAHNGDEAIELFDWCGVAVEAVKRSKESLSSNSSKAADLERAVEVLKGQLEELIQAKKEDEAELLEKFRDLLNEKKVKIRQQQRIIAAAPGQGSQPVGTHPSEPSRRAGKGHAPKPSRASKRKAMVKEESSEDDGFERMDTDQNGSRPGAAPPESDGDSERQTSDEATASEADDEEPVAPSRSAKASQPPASSTDETAPPKRALPFASRKALKAATKAATKGSETETDDEL